MAGELGLSLVEEKMEGPSTSLTFLGIKRDTRMQASRLPDNKLKEFQAWLSGLLRKRKVSLKGLQEIIGHLNFTCRVVAPGRAFFEKIM